MKKFCSLFLLVVLMAFVANAANEIFYVTKAIDKSVVPNNVTYVELLSEGATAGDTLLTTQRRVVGPIPLAVNAGDPMFTKATHIFTGSAGTSSTTSLGYAVTNKPVASDIVTWTEIDTLADTAEEINFDIGKYGRYLWIRYHNYDGTTTIFAKRSAIQLYKPVNYQYIIKQ